jgi:hypothetical protein
VQLIAGLEKNQQGATSNLHEQMLLAIIRHRREILTVISVPKIDHLDVNAIALRLGTGAMVPGVLRSPEECVRVREGGKLRGRSYRQRRRGEVTRSGRAPVAARSLSKGNRRVSGHLQVAASVAGRLAGAGVSSEPAALAYDLRFIPLAAERFGLVIPGNLVPSAGGPGPAESAHVAVAADPSWPACPATRPPPESWQGSRR